MEDCVDRADGEAALDANDLDDNVVAVDAGDAAGMEVTACFKCFGVPLSPLPSNSMLGFLGEDTADWRDPGRLTSRPATGGRSFPGEQRVHSCVASFVNAS